jgi:hypothetical protein
VSTIDYIAARVARGAALLDEKRPGWEREIEIESIRMIDPCFCVLGQLYETYWDALEPFLGCSDKFVGNVIATERGFNADHDSGIGYLALQEEWVRVIKDRQEQVTSD